MLGLHTPARRPRGGWLALPVAVLLAALAACGGGAGDGAVSRDAWAPLRSEGSEIEWYDTVEDLADASNLVVVGRVSGFEPGRELAFDGDDPAAGSLVFVDAVVDVDEVLSGDIAPVTLAVEFATPVGSADELPEYLEELDAVVGHGDVVLFLRDKGTSVAGVPPLPEEAGLLRVVNSYGLVTATTEAPVDTPLGEVPAFEEQPEGGVGPHSVSMDPRDQWADLDELIAHVRDHLD